MRLLNHGVLRILRHGVIKSGSLYSLLEGGTYSTAGGPTGVPILDGLLKHGVLRVLKHRVGQRVRGTLELLLDGEQVPVEVPVLRGQPYGGGEVGVGGLQVAGGVLGLGPRLVRLVHVRVSLQYLK